MTDILNTLGLKKPANINNTNNNNNTNDTNNKLTTTTLIWSKDTGKEEEVVTPSSLGSLREEKDFSQKKVVKRLPPEWRGVKCDLYCNGYNKDGTLKMKLNIGVIRHIDGAQVALQASLNSSWDDSVRRGVDKTAWNTDPHWIRAKQHRKELEYIYDIRASKIGLKQKHGGTEMVAFLYQHGPVWHVDILRAGEIYTVPLADPLSANAHQNHVATGYAGARSRTLIKPEELGI